MLTTRKLAALALGLMMAVLAAAPARAVEPDKWVPADAEAVVVINVRQTLDSPLIKAHAIEKLKEELQKDDHINKLLKAAGIDPLKDIDSVMLTFNGVVQQKDPLVVVRGKFNPEKFHAAASDFAKQNPTELKITGEGKSRIYQIVDKDGTAFLSLPDSNTIVGARTKEFLESALKRDTATAIKKDMKSALEKVKPDKESIWGAMVITDEMRKGLAGTDQTKDLAAKLDSLTGSLSVAGDVQFSALIHTTDAASAQNLTKQLNTFAKPVLVAASSTVDDKFKPFLELVAENLKIVNKDKAAILDIKLGEEQLKKAGEQK